MAVDKGSVNLNFLYPRSVFPPATSTNPHLSELFPFTPSMSPSMSDSKPVILSSLCIANQIPVQLDVPKKRQRSFKRRNGQSQRKKRNPFALSFSGTEVFLSLEATVHFFGLYGRMSETLRRGLFAVSSRWPDLRLLSLSSPYIAIAALIV